MANRALLIASQTFGLTGCDADAALMRGVLEARGFDAIDVRSGADASREGILDAVESLIGATSEQDAAVLYYSGHGGRIRHRDWERRQAEGLPAHVQFIVPWDLEQSTEANFRGLLAEELSDLQWRLTDRTKNVTTILDCCHSGYMARDADLVPKAIARDFPIEGALARLEALPPQRRDAGADTNPHAVRVVACQPEQSAYERASELLPGHHGVLTESLVLVLRELGDRPLSWAALGDLIRQRILLLVPQQRPEVEGPAARVPFSLVERTRPHAFPVTVDQKTVAIDAAPLLGISAGDTFRLVSPDDERELGTAEVDRVEAGRALLRVSRAAGRSRLPEPCDAVPVVTALPRSPVRVDADGAARFALDEAVRQSPRLRPAEGEEPVLATIRAAERGLVVEDGAGLPLRTSRLAGDEEGRDAAVELVEVLAAAERLRALGSGRGDSSLEAPVAVELATHGDAGRTVLKPSGERLFAGDRVSVTVRNLGAGELFFWLFDVGVSSRTALVTNDASSGRRLAPAGSAGDTSTVGGPAGVGMTWPQDVPADAGRAEQLLVVIADRQQDLRPLQTPAGARARAPADSPLDAVLDEVRTGVREWAPSGEATPLRYRIERLEFFLEPLTRPRLEEPAFELDDRPDPSVRGLLPRAAEPPPATVAVRLVELAVLKNRALFRAAVRVDSLVLTRDGSGAGIAQPRTFRFPNISDAELLPIDDVILYHGDVGDFLELALWVNRDDAKGKDLAELFSGELGRPEVRNALVALGGLVVAAPQAAAAFGAVAAVATLVTVGARLVQAATGRDIGTYRTSKLAFERFGEGRTPAAGRRRAQDVEFAYEVIDVSA